MPTDRPLSPDDAQRVERELLGLERARLALHERWPAFTAHILGSPAFSTTADTLSFSHRSRERVATWRVVVNSGPHQWAAIEYTFAMPGTGDLPTRVYLQRSVNGYVFTKRFPARTGCKEDILGSVSTSVTAQQVADWVLDAPR